MNMLVSDKGDQYKFAINTDTYYFQLVSTRCNNIACDVPKHYNESASESAQINNTIGKNSWVENIFTYKDLS